jgi:hypothetical protein
VCLGVYASRNFHAAACYDSLYVTGAEVAKPKIMGEYRKIEGSLQGGRPVYLRVTKGGSNRYYLYYLSQYGSWNIGTETDFASSKGTFSFSNGTRAMCPEQATGFTLIDGFAITIVQGGVPQPRRCLPSTGTRQKALALRGVAVLMGALGCVDMYAYGMCY